MCLRHRYTFIEIYFFKTVLFSTLHYEPNNVHLFKLRKRRFYNNKMRKNTFEIALTLETPFIDLQLS